MATPPPRRYEPEELLRLAKSPLVKKPAGLPPIEEWMGPASTRPAATRARTDGDIMGNFNANGADEVDRGNSTGPIHRRPSIFNESRMSRSSIPENIVLGPPKMSFASSSARNITGKFEHESARNASLTSAVFDDDRTDAAPAFQRFKSFGGFGRGEDKERDTTTRDFSDLRGGFNKRRDDGEGGSGWTNVSRPPRKSFGAEDGAEQRERFTRKEQRGDGEKKTTPWDRPAKYENFGKERERNGERGDRSERDHRGRGKRDESSWLLDDHRGERRDDHRGERARDNHREHNRFGSNAGRAEKDPEWMTEGDGKSGDNKAAHSMEDFQKWKERMKAAAVGADTPKKVDEPIEKAPEPVQEPEPRIESRHSPEEKQPFVHEEPMRQASNPRDDRDAGVSLMQEAMERDHHPRQMEQLHHGLMAEPQQTSENGVDRFFGFWSGNTVLKSPEQGDIISAPRAEPRVGKSRFTSLFSPPIEQSHSPPLNHLKEQQHQMPVNRTPPYAHSPAHENGNEDREGFQRILKMLGTTSLNGNEQGPMPTTGLLSRPPQSNMGAPNMGAPNMGAPNMGGMNPHQPQLQSQNNLHHLAAQGRESDAAFLMGLMRGEQPPPPQQHRQQQHSHAPTPVHNKYGSSQMPPPPPIDTSILHYGNRGNHTISPQLDDPAVQMFRPRPNQESSPIHHNTRGPLHIMDHHGPPPGWNHQSVSQAPPPQAHRQVAPPPGFPRAQHQQGPPPPPPFLPPPGVNGPPVPFQLLNGLNGPLPPNMPPPHMYIPNLNNGPGGPNGMGGMNGMNGGLPPFPGSNMNGPPQGNFPMGFPPHHHPDAMLGGMQGGPPFYPHHDGLKSPPFGHGPPNKGIMR
ncbi:hypothetical protein FPQ18DRAFT_71374 [Pyronema domesticum]|uniref:Uncharacterized protein n=1 Tax=Pyronema omphalodes (strain CBS 100304) TaxID=1076935 RepID=U4LVG5_PYROM|nr:hypothetical protein FPQ18DRAFT_71374 [Pyronema domesticum]CCX34552.1 Similar to hypothetical protein [Tuber melanosporum Mel28]; acc. no. XP_002841063 [Pyronema omphalodes CBS 100304]